MLRYEIRKVFSKSKNRIAVIVLFVILVITSILTINKVEFVDENGNSSVGISASRDLREAKNQWAGYLTTDTLSKALEENKTINSSKEALSDDITEQNKAYAKKQGIAGIMDVIICAFSDYRDYNYYAPDHISDDEVGTIYERRIITPSTPPRIAPSTRLPAGTLTSTNMPHTINTRIVNTLPTPIATYHA